MPFRVLIVDDSAFIRRALKRILGAEPDFEVTASAANGRLALRALEEHTVDVVVLDVEMPVMGGLETLAAIRARDRSLPVVMFSTLTTQGSESTMEALTRGASDYVAKPSNQESQEQAFQTVRDHLVPKLRSLAESHAIRRRRVNAPIVPKHAPAPDAAASSPVPEAAPRAPKAEVPPAAAAVPVPQDLPAPRARRRTQGVDLVAIGVSTGGPTALQTVLGSLPADLGVPVVITQHMPPQFTALLAARLDNMSALSVGEAAEGEALRPGRALLAPGDFHMRVVRDDAGTRVALDQGPPVNSCRPAVDVMLESIAPLFADRVLVVILTGMGRDGLEGSRRLADLGAHVLAQDAATSVVWGMPGFVAKEGVADAVLPLDEIGPEITRIVRAHGRVQGQPA